MYVYLFAAGMKHWFIIFNLEYSGLQPDSIRV